MFALSRCDRYILPYLHIVFSKAYLRRCYVMYGSACKAIVPYVPVKAKRSFFSSIFDARFRLYAFSFCCCVCVLFAAYSFCGRFVFLSSIILNGVGTFFYSHIKFVLILYVAGFTVFSPVSYLVAILTYSFYTGVLLFGIRSFMPRLAACVFLFVSLLYFCEIFFCYYSTRYGIRQIFSPRRVFSFSSVTLAYILLSMLYFGYNCFEG